MTLLSATRSDVDQVLVLACRLVVTTLFLLGQASVGHHQRLIFPFVSIS
jgi:hypothetical protein